MVTGTLPIWDTKIVKIVFINNKNEKNICTTLLLPNKSCPMNLIY